MIILNYRRIKAFVCNCTREKISLNSVFLLGTCQCFFLAEWGRGGGQIEGTTSRGFAAFCENCAKLIIKWLRSHKRKL